MNATAPIKTTALDRPRSTAPATDPASAGRFELLWEALREAPPRKRPERAMDPNVEPVMVSAASMNTALARVKPDRLTDALTAFKRESSLTFTRAALASVYVSAPAERGAPPAQNAFMGRAGG